MNYNKAGAHLRMLGYQKASVVRKTEFWTCDDKNTYIYNHTSKLWDMVPIHISRPMNKTLHMLNDPSK